MPSENPFCIEPEIAEVRRWVDLAMWHVARHIETLPDQPAAHVEGAVEASRSLREPMPEQGTAVEPLLRFLFEEAIPRSYNTAGPGYLAYIPGGGILHSAVADLIADATNRYVGVAAAAPLLVQLELNVIRWFCQIVHYPPGSGGVLTTGGSLANFTAVVAARRDRLPENFLSGTIYASAQVHHSVQKSAALAGFPEHAVREIATDSAFRMRMDALESAIAADRAAGSNPFLVVGSAGTTNTGAVDDLTAIGELARRESLWFHVDGAYGGFFMLTERGQSAMRGIESADSITLDPHKGLFLPYGTGSLLVRDVNTLRRAHSADAEYLPAMQQGTELEDFCELSPELSRDFRGLRVWLPVKMCGIGEFRRQLDEKLDLAAWAAGEIRNIEHMSIVAEPQLSIVAFRLTPPHIDPTDWNRLNEDLLERINARKRVFLTATKVERAFVIRICVLSFRTHRPRMEQALEDIRAAATEAVGEFRPS
ncbi:MAG: pyridoxal-dependent decarboxylase [Acidobacteriota bacterium]